MSNEYEQTRNFIAQYVALGETELTVVSVWAMHTWLFSPQCVQPATTPYLYITAAKGSGKTLLGQDVLGSIVRAPVNTVGITGPGLIRIVGGATGDDDEESTVSVAPTLTIDEVDALYSGAKDETLRMMLNAGYRRGGMVPRVVGQAVVNYSAYCPKILMGIDNGHLPDTVTDRAIRIELKQATPEQMLALEPFYFEDAEPEAAALSDALSRWAIKNSTDIAAYRPVPIPGLRPRQWEIARTLVRVAHVLDIEHEVRDALRRLLTAEVARDPKARMYETIRALFDDTDTDRVTTADLLEALTTAGVSVPGGNGKGLASAIVRDGGKAAVAIRMPDTGKIVRGYYRYHFDVPFSKYLNSKEGE